MRIFQENDIKSAKFVIAQLKIALGNKFEKTIMYDSFLEKCIKSRDYVSSVSWIIRYFHELNIVECEFNCHEQYIYKVRLNKERLDEAYEYYKCINL